MVDLDKFLESAYQQARRVLLNKKDAELTPIWAMIRDDDEIMAVGTPFQGPADKPLVAAYMRDFMTKNNVVAYCFLCEAWMAVLPRGIKSTDGFDPPSQQPNREEIVIALASSATETKSRQWMMVRDKSGRVTALPERKFEGAGSMFGTFDGLLQKPQ